LSPPEERRKHDKFPLEVRQYIEAAAEAGAEKAILKLYAEIGKAGVKKSLWLLGAGLAAFLSWLGITWHLPK
jgi:hypothetical protein